MIRLSRLCWPAVGIEQISQLCDAEPKAAGGSELGSVGGLADLSEAESGEETQVDGFPLLGRQPAQLSAGSTSVDRRLDRRIGRGRSRHQQTDLTVVEIVQVVVIAASTQLVHGAASGDGQQVGQGIGDSD